jgi:hypothetical protein
MHLSLVLAVCASLLTLSAHVCPTPDVALHFAQVIREPFNYGPVTNSYAALLSGHLLLNPQPLFAPPALCLVRGINS